MPEESLRYGWSPNHFGLLELYVVQFGSNCIHHHIRLVKFQDEENIVLSSPLFRCQCYDQITWWFNTLCSRDRSDCNDRDSLLQVGEGIVYYTSTFPRFTLKCMNASKKAQKEMGVQECFQVPPAELVPHQTFEKLLPLINLHERSLLGLFLSHCSYFVLAS